MKTAQDFFNVIKVRSESWRWACCSAVPGLCIPPGGTPTHQIDRGREALLPSHSTKTEKHCPYVWGGMCHQPVQMEFVMEEWWYECWTIQTRYFRNAPIKAPRHHGPDPRLSKHLAKPWPLNSQKCLFTTSNCCWNFLSFFPSYSYKFFVESAPYVLRSNT